MRRPRLNRHGVRRGGDICEGVIQAKEDDECEDYERRDEDAQTQEAENADAGNN